MILPTEVYFRRRGNSNEYKIIKLVGSGKIVTDNNSVYRVGEMLPEDEFDKLMAWLTNFQDASPYVEVALR